MANKGFEDPDAGVRTVRNVAFIMVIYCAALIAYFIASVSLTIGVIAGLGRVITIYVDYAHSLPETLRQLWVNYSFYWGYWFKYRAQLNFVHYNYLVPKLWLSTLLPWAFLLALVKANWNTLIGWRIFKGKEALHGDAHWATASEIKKAGLFDKSGILLGEYQKGRYFIVNNYQHILLFAPTGSGKGVGFVIPNLLFWKESLICHDIKLENYDLTSGYRTQVLKQKTYVWEPANPEGYSHCYNPLDWISKSPGKMVDDVQKICKIVLPKFEFWENEARTLVVGLILYLLADPEKTKSFGEIVRTLRSDDVAYALAAALDTLGDEIHPVGYMNIAAFLQKAEKERSGVISTANSGLELWANPLIDKTTSRSDFDIRQFKKQTTSVFVGLTPDNVERLKPLMGMFYQQATAFLSQQMPQKDEPYGVLFLMDEFPTLGKLEQFLSGIAYFRGYRVKLFLIVQDTQQLKGTYEDAGMNSFLSNATYRITFAANNVETARLISELIGNKTVLSESFNRPKFFDMNPASRSLHMSKSQRALLLPQEVISLARDEQIILIEASPPIRCKKIFYYKDPFFMKRLMKAPAKPKQKPYIPKKTGTRGQGKSKKTQNLLDTDPTYSTNFSKDSEYKSPETEKTDK
jgi:type IV secretion system protein VirD4